jgi:hypothetical protein
MFNPRAHNMKKFTITLALISAIAYNDMAQAHSDDLSAASALSAFPIAVSVAAPALVLSAGTLLVVKAVEVTAHGTVWVLERASDGARVSVEVAASTTLGASAMVGGVVTVSVIGAGTVLSLAGEVIAFIPNELGKALLYNERITR